MEKTIIAVFLLLSAFNASEVLAQTKCVDSEGEAVIVNSDVPSVARAKWHAVEQVV
ncbi:MAG: hypothetical protein HY759_06355 [Nitrospirae bacterium]|nr:hypothetical protein [Nitrospirota bacterium]